jgi:hypothetical protein
MSRSAKNMPKRLRSLARALRPGVKPFRDIITADAGRISSAGLEPLKLAFRELQLDSDNETDWKTLAALLALQRWSGAVMCPACLCGRYGRWP